MDQTFEERHRQMVLREELKAIRTELGLEKPQTETLLAKCKERIAALKLPEHAKKVIEEEMVLLFPPTCSFNRKLILPKILLGKIETNATEFAGLQYRADVYRLAHSPSMGHPLCRSAGYEICTR